jgi:hypothetical protein
LLICRFSDSNIDRFADLLIQTFADLLIICRTSKISKIVEISKILLTAIICTLNQMPPHMRTANQQNNPCIHDVLKNNFQGLASYILEVLQKRA